MTTKLTADHVAMINAQFTDEELDILRDRFRVLVVPAVAETLAIYGTFLTSTTVSASETGPGTGPETGTGTARGFAVAEAAAERCELDYQRLAQVVAALERFVSGGSIVEEYTRYGLGDDFDIQIQSIVLHQMFCHEAQINPLPRPSSCAKDGLSWTGVPTACTDPETCPCHNSETLSRATLLDQTRTTADAIMDAIAHDEDLDEAVARTRPSLRTGQLL